MAAVLLREGQQNGVVIEAIASIKEALRKWYRLDGMNSRFFRMAVTVR
jgi:hypothetical protein